MQFVRGQVCTSVLGGIGGTKSVFEKSDRAKLFLAPRTFDRIPFTDICLNVNNANGVPDTDRVERARISGLRWI